MIDDMTLRRFGEKTQSDYIRHVKTFTVFLGRAPNTAEPEDLRRIGRLRGCIARGLRSDSPLRWTAIL